MLPTPSPPRPHEYAGQPPAGLCFGSTVGPHVQSAVRRQRSTVQPTDPSSPCSTAVRPRRQPWPSEGSLLCPARHEHEPPGAEPYNRPHSHLAGSIFLHRLAKAVEASAYVRSSDEQRRSLMMMPRSRSCVHLCGPLPDVIVLNLNSSPSTVGKLPDSSYPKRQAHLPDTAQPFRSSHRLGQFAWPASCVACPPKSRRDSAPTPPHRSETSGLAFRVSTSEWAANIRPTAGTQF